MTRVLTVGCKIPGEFGEFVGFGSQASLLDADFVVFEPSIDCWQFGYQDQYQGKPTLSDNGSFKLKEAIAHWRKELVDYLDSGRTVFMFMSDLEEIFVDTGLRDYSGTGRNRQTIRKVEILTNYELLPFNVKIAGSKGNRMRIEPGVNALREYWQAFGEESQYRVYFEAANAVNSLVVTREGNRVVGATFRTKGGGILVALPWLDLAREEFFDVDSEYDDEQPEWTSSGKAWGKQLFGILVSLDTAIRSQNTATPTPQWAMVAEYATNEENALSKKLARIKRQIAALEKELEDAEVDLGKEGSLKALLFEQGDALEDAVREAMALMGFKADRYQDSDSEFDAVLECAEGRFIGEIEGRDNKAIGIGKMRQLEVNVLEDFERDDVSVPARKILFGNAFRLTPPSERPSEPFTAKCVSAAGRNGTALIRTADLFEVAKALSDNFDEQFAAACRNAILNTNGEEVKFPPTPELESNDRIAEITLEAGTQVP